MTEPKGAVWRHDLAVFIGRLQPFHRGHLAVIMQGLDEAQRVLVLIGSATGPRCHRNPFTFAERAWMIRDSLPAEVQARLIIEPLDDHTYADSKWIAEVQAIVARHSDATTRIALIGHAKDASSFYLRLFPQWDSITVGNVGMISATPIREAYFSHSVIQRVVPEAVFDFLVRFQHTEAFATLTQEFRFIDTYRQQWASAPYPPTFVTVDAVVVQSGHILLVKRRGHPGKGLWALPGGFLNPNEKIEDGILRELREETKLKVPDPVLRGSMVATRVFDDPHRSARGRTITHAALISLKPDTRLPEVKAGSDARAAKWVPISAVNRADMFEDHFYIIHSLMGASR